MIALVLCICLYGCSANNDAPAYSTETETGANGEIYVYKTATDDSGTLEFRCNALKVINHTYTFEYKRGVQFELYPFVKNISDSDFKYKRSGVTLLYCGEYLMQPSYICVDDAIYSEPLILKSRQQVCILNEAYRVPDDAPSGSYDLKITIRDENGDPVSAVIKDFLKVID